MENNDTVSLLKECNAGVKMGVSSIEEVLDHIKSEKLKNILSENKEMHQKLGSEIHSLLENEGEEGKDPSPIAQGMSWIKTNVMLSLNENDQTVSDLITDGCNMGVKSLSKYLNQYSSADENAKRIAGKLIDLEYSLSRDLRPFL